MTAHPVAEFNVRHSHAPERRRMGYSIRGVEYFYAIVKDRPGEGYKTLSQLAAEGVILEDGAEGTRWRLAG